MYFWGQRLNAETSAALYRRMAWVTSSPERYPAGATMRDLLRTLELVYPTWNRALASELLAGFKIRVDQNISALSLGENTKVRLIKALGFEPELLLLDELTANLSPDSKDAVIAVLLDLFARKKMAVLYVCHSTSEAMSLSDRIFDLGSEGLWERGGANAQ